MSDPGHDGPRAGGPASSVFLPAVRDPAHTPAVGETVEQAGQVALGALLLVGDGIAAVFRQAVPEQVAPPPPTAQGPSAAVAARRVAVGLAFDAQRRAAEVADATAKVVMPTVGWLLSSPLARPVMRRVSDGLDRAYQQGLLEEETARDLATRTGEQTVRLGVPLVLDEIDLEPVVVRVLDELDLKPVIARVLDELDLPALVDQVMGELDLAPIVERVLGQLDMAGLVQDIIGEVDMSGIVMQASGGITGDIATQVRNRSADGDALVERVVAKVLRRKVAALPPPAVQEALPPPVQEAPS